MSFLSGVKGKSLRCTCGFGLDGNPERNTSVRKSQKVGQQRETGQEKLRNIGEEVDVSL